MLCTHTDINLGSGTTSLAGLVSIQRKITTKRSNSLAARLGPNAAFYTQMIPDGAQELPQTHWTICTLVVCDKKHLLLLLQHDH